MRAGTWLVLLAALVSEAVAQGNSDKNRNNNNGNNGKKNGNSGVKANNGNNGNGNGNGNGVNGNKNGGTVVEVTNTILDGSPAEPVKYFPIGVEGEGDGGEIELPFFPPANQPPWTFPVGKYKRKGGGPEISLKPERKFVNLAVPKALRDEEVERIIPDKTGNTIVHSTKTMNGVKVVGSRKVKLEKSVGGNSARHEEFLLGAYEPNCVLSEHIDTTPALSRQDAIEAAIDAAGNMEQMAKVKDELVIKCMGSNRQRQGTFHLTYSVQLSQMSPQGTGYEEPRCFVDAHTGAILNRYNNLKSASLDDNNKVTYECFETDCDNTGHKGIADSSDKAASDLHDYVQTVLDFITKWGRDSYDNKGRKVKSHVHVQSKYVNAYWSASRDGFYYGDGDGVNANNLAVLDVCAHEMAHAVTEYSSNLEYQDEPGALNEGISDVFAAVVEACVDSGSCNPKAGDGSFKSSDSVWYIGEDAWLDGVALRCMQRPSACGSSNRDHYDNRYIGSADNGGVHWNSGILNHFFYLLSVGGVHHNSQYANEETRVTGIGIHKAWEIIAKSWTDMWGVTTDFFEARSTMISACNTLYPPPNYTSVCEAVNRAWAQVGVAPQCSKNSDCNDGNDCNGEETCKMDTGVCQPGTAKTCDNTNKCVESTCNSTSGNCDTTPKQCDAYEGGNTCKPLDKCDPSEGCLYKTETNCCGNGMCDPGESCDSCKEDCCKEFETEMEPNLVYYGNMFHINCKQDLTVKNLMLHLYQDEDVEVDLYMMEGLYAGSELDKSKWTQLRTKEIVPSKGLGNRSPMKGGLKVACPKGKQISFYVTSPARKILFKRSDGALRKMHKSNDYMEFFEGNSINTDFQEQMYQPRIFNGVIVFEAGVGTSAPTVPPPSSSPSASPSSQPSSSPSASPSSKPSASPSSQPSSSPSASPSSKPSSSPSASPSSQPSSNPSAAPSSQPSGSPSDVPSKPPTNKPSSSPSGMPSDVPSKPPTSKPSAVPSKPPSDVPSGSPSDVPSNAPIPEPSGRPSGSPSDVPSMAPVPEPSSLPSGSPSAAPSRSPVKDPVPEPSKAPSHVPSTSPSREPSSKPSSKPSERPSSQPSGSPSDVPSMAPVPEPSSQPSDSPSAAPSRSPVIDPVAEPSTAPSDLPSKEPSPQPSPSPSESPSDIPSKAPVESPSSQPSASPSDVPSDSPVMAPSSKPSGSPSESPSGFPSKAPIIEPSSQPSESPSDPPAPSSATLTLEVQPDQYGSETSWKLDKMVVNADVVESTVKEIRPNIYPNSLEPQLYTYTEELSDGLYVLTVSDTFGDGMCCNYGSGYYRCRINNDMVVEDLRFTGSRTQTEFEVRGGKYYIAKDPTSSPTKSPSPTSTPAPSSTKEINVGDYTGNYITFSFMFDTVCKEDLSFMDMLVHKYGSTAFNVEVYTKTGSFVESEYSMDNWEPVHLQRNQLTLQDREGQPTTLNFKQPVICNPCVKGGKRGWLVSGRSSKSFRSTRAPSGSAVGSMFHTDGTVEIMRGKLMTGILPPQDLYETYQPNCGFKYASRGSPSCN